MTEKSKKKKLCIVGCSDTRKQTPFHLHEEFEFWGVNNLYYSFKSEHWSRWFELHLITYDGIKYLRRGLDNFRGMPILQYLNDLGKLDIPVYMQQAWPMIPKAVPYPLQEIIKNYGNYFTNTISYMLALGIYEGFEEIHVYGVDMAVDTEYFWQRPSCEFFIGVAAGKGIKVVLPDECDLLKTRFLYGFQELLETKWMKKVANMTKSIDQRMQEAMQKQDLERKKVDQYIGAKQTLHELNKIWKNLTDPKDVGVV